MTSSSNSSQSTRPVGRVLWEELLVLSRFHRNYEWTSEIFGPLPSSNFLTDRFKAVLPVAYLRHFIEYTL